MKFIARLASAAGMAACAAIVLTSAASSASADVAPPATTSTNVSFIVPLVSDPLQTEVPVSGEIVDPMVTDVLAAFTIILDCDGLAPVHVSVSAARLDTSGSKPVLRSAIRAFLPVAEEGGRCNIETTAPSTSRALLFGAPSTKPGGPGSTVQLNFSGTVLLNVTTRGGAY